MRFVTEKRLIVYPRIIFLTVYTILGLNLLFHSGWQGGGGQIIGTDFVTLYSAGLIYRQAPPDLYNFETQFEIQKAILDPTPLAGVNPFISPPYVALAYSPLTLLPLSIAFLVWLVFSLVLAYFSARILISLVPERIQNAGLNLQQFLIVILSFFPFAWGLMVGQNHALTLFLLSGLVLASLKKRMVLAGALAGLLLYKPNTSSACSLSGWFGENTGRSSLSSSSDRSGYLFL